MKNEKSVNLNSKQSLRNYLDEVKKEFPQGLLTINKKINPKFEVSAILKHLEDLNKYPAIIFKNLLNLKGQPGCEMIINIAADRRRLAIALGLPPENYKFDLTKEVSERSSHPIDFSVIKSNDAPVREIIIEDNDIDLRDYPILKFHELDGGHYFTSPVIAKDPMTGIYNSSFHRLMLRTKDELNICMAPFHLLRIFKENEKKGISTPAAVILGHHPCIFLASAMRVPFESDELKIAGGLLKEPLKLIPSLTWGDELLVPAEAEIILEGEILPNRLEPEGPFGEWTGYYSGQRQSEVFKVKAISQRKDPIIVNIFTSHREAREILLGWEAEVLTRTKTAVPGVKAVSLSSSASGMHCYISLNKISDGEPKLAALAAASMGFFKAIIVVDSDIDVYNEKEVMWALSVRFQADRDADIVRGHLGSMLDPSMDKPRTHTVVLIDATEPKDRLNPKRVNIPTEVLEKIKLSDYIQPDILKITE